MREAVEEVAGVGARRQHATVVEADLGRGEPAIHLRPGAHHRAHADAGLRELRDEEGGVPPLTHLEVDVEAIRVPRSREQSARGGEVASVGRERGVVAEDVRADHLADRRAEAAQHLGDQTLAIERQVDRPAHLQAVEGRAVDA